MPEQPVVLTPKRKPMPLPRLARNFSTRLAAVSVSDIAIDYAVTFAACFALMSATAALIASSANTEQ
jgi:hypothetical protein